MPRIGMFGISAKFMSHLVRGVGVVVDHNVLPAGNRVASKGLGAVRSLFRTRIRNVCHALSL